jgi:hypothetical protein
LQQGATMAGPGPPGLIPAQGRAAPPDPQLGRRRVLNPPQGQQGRPGLDGAIDGRQPALLPRVGWIRGRLDPEAPLGQAGPAPGGAAQGGRISGRGWSSRTSPGSRGWVWAGGGRCGGLGRWGAGPERRCSISTEWACRQGRRAGVRRAGAGRCRHGQSGWIGAGRWLGRKDRIRPCGLPPLGRCVERQGLGRQGLDQQEKDVGAAEAALAAEQRR